MLSPSLKMTPDESFIMQLHLISRSDAKTLTMKSYFTGKPCKRGHVSERYVSNTECYMCSISEEAKAKMKAWRKSAKDHIAEYEKNNKERLSKRFATYRNKNKEILQEKIKKWRQDNPQKILDGRAAYYKKHRLEILKKARENPEARRCAVRNRRARIKKSQGTHSKQDVLKILKYQNRKCANCARCVASKYHVDHVMPIALGGSNSPENLQILCPKCNLKKNKKHPDVWAKENGRLI